MDYLDESVADLYNDPAILEAMEQMDEDVQNEPQGYGLQEATLFDEF